MLDYFFNASGVVKLVMFLLLLASLISWALIFHRSSFLKQAGKQARDFQERFFDAVDLAQMYNSLNQRKSAKALTGLASVFQAGFKEFVRYKKQGATNASTLEGVERAMAIAEAKEMDKLDQSLSTLATIGSTSPYVGLFGTVWGIMTSFQALGSAQQATIAMVAPGISEALIATAMGLFAAIPAVIAFNRLSNKATQLANQYSIFREEMMAIFARQLHTGVGAVNRPAAHDDRYSNIEDEEQYA